MGITVFLADDHTVMRNGLQLILQSETDIKVVGEASDGEAAVKGVLKTCPDVVIMDIAMPMMDGLEATRRILKKSPRVKIIILSQYDDKKYILASIKAGSAGYLPKRALGMELVSAIRALHQGGSYLYPTAANAIIEGFLNQSEDDDPYELLTNREREVLKLIADGFTSRAIAEKLCISLKTVLSHRAKVMEKLDFHNRTELIKFAMRKGLVEAET